MSKYRKKPIVVEAFQLTTTGYIPDWFKQAFIDHKISDLVVSDSGFVGCTIQTLEGNLHAAPEDYIIKDVDGELYTCKSSVFRKTYEPVPEKEEEDTHL